MKLPEKNYLKVSRSNRTGFRFYAEGTLAGTFSSPMLNENRFSEIVAHFNASNKNEFEAKVEEIRATHKLDQVRVTDGALACFAKGKALKAGKGVGRKKLPDTKVVATRLPVELIEKHGIDGDWLKEAVELKINSK